MRFAVSHAFPTSLKRTCLKRTTWNKPAVYRALTICFDAYLGWKPLNTFQDACYRKCFQFKDCNGITVRRTNGRVTPCQVAAASPVAARTNLGRRLGPENKAIDHR
ncbi:hypothetical protein FIB18_15375 [Brucella pecoris]|uniref:Uncharacterized protein n=1 Tax=Brucella pecoris TaxID=867683 RepID=A0A5C5CIQ7_9HYPH|nr:hypothetical protein FIB18_15375 [Brucella pecoris]